MVAVTAWFNIYDSGLPQFVCVGKCFALQVQLLSTDSTALRLFGDNLQRLLGDFYQTAYGAVYK